MGISIETLGPAARKQVLSQFGQLTKAPKPNKYRNRRTTVDGIKFDSAKEAARYQSLLLLLRANRIGHLERQPEIELHVLRDGVLIKIDAYRADFAYYDYETAKQVYEDVKSPATAKDKLYVWKKRHVEAEYGIEIREV